MVITVLSAAFFTAACISEPTLDKSKFAELNRAAQDVKAAITSGRQCEIPDSVVQRLASQTAALRDKMTTKREMDLLWAYSDLLTMTRDGLLLCRFRTHLSDAAFVAKGRIYVTQDLDPLIERYGLPTETHVYKPTGAHWKSISSDAGMVIWKRAEAEIKNIENRLKYN